ncbi:MAG: C-terminal binding protein [Thermoplasmata archaeon]
MLSFRVLDLLPPPFHSIEVEVLSGLADVDIQEYEDEASLREMVADIDALLLWYSIPVPQGVIAGMEKCKVIVDAGVGYDNIDLEAAGRKGICVCNVPDYCVDEVADHTLGLILALTRKISSMNKSVHSGQWDFRLAIPVTRLRGKVLGVVGLGRIGSAVALRCHALGMRILVYDPYIPPGKERSFGAEAVSWNRILEESDVLTLHVPLTEETRHMVGPDEFRRMKDTAVVINTSRGEVIAREALQEALEAGLIAGAACDVLEDEPPIGGQFDPEDPLLQHDNFVVTPHMAFFSYESGVELRTKAAEEVARVLKGEEPRAPVNLEYLRR